MSPSMEIVDLTRTIEEGMTVFPTYWHPEVEIKQLGTLADEGRETRKVTLGTHTGTHVDAPLHFIDDGRSIDQLPLDILMGPVSLLDFTGLGDNDSVTKQMLERYELSSRLLFRFGWENRWGDADSFYNDYPYLTIEAAEYLVKHRVKLLGFDTPSPDASSKSLNGGDEDSPVHKILLDKNVVLVEYLQNLDDLAESDDWNIAALPLKVLGADGMPARVVAWR